MVGIVLYTAYAAIVSILRQLVNIDKNLFRSISRQVLAAANRVLITFFEASVVEIVPFLLWNGGIVLFYSTSHLLEEGLSKLFLGLHGCFGMSIFSPQVFQSSWIVDIAEPKPRMSPNIAVIR